MKEGWEIKKLGEVGKIITGSTPSTKDESNYSSDDYCFVKPSDIENDKVTHINETEFHISENAYKKARQLPKNTVLTTCIGIVGKIGVLEVDATCNQQINAIIPNPQIVTSSYLAYSLLACKTKFEHIANAPVVPIINKKNFSDVTIPIPPLSGQAHIVSELDLLNNIIAKKRQQLKELDALSQSIFYDMFGDPVTNEKGWDFDKMQTVAPIKESKNEIQNVNGKFWLLNLDKVMANSGEVIDRVYLDISDIGSSTIKFDEKMVLYSKLRPYLNKVVLPSTSGYSTSELLPLNPNESILNRVFLAYLLRSQQFVSFISEKVAGAKMPRVTMTDFRSFSVILPPLPLQEQFASRIALIEQQKQLIQSSLSETETLLHSRMDYYFN